ncbi:hypothetical protein MAPG_01818 [Magnaporthiopsis poae ATCC 64411]|uniref:Uncharacterized protein n=1 Tax=Magnaporthiopsis poae (strain ATCC 64411 / 73-15) TaxID=644358 RepID=A0A0C4DPP7_MAGP6|nr:hypothetical protein MAPG_01818 [Magnaporthiopsis poae ATCC 64411]
MSLTPGAMAGAAVGFAACGALVATIVTLVICRLRPTKRERIDDDPDAHLPHRLKHPAVMYMADAIKELDPGLGDLAKSLMCHVDQMVVACCARPLEDRIDTSDLVAIVGDGEDWDALLRHPLGSTMGLQALAMRVIAPWLDPYGDPDNTLFPPDLLRLYQASISKFGKKPGLRAAQKAWLKITVHIMSEATPQYALVRKQKFADDDPRLPNVIKLEEQLARVLERFGITDQQLADMNLPEDEMGWHGNIRTKGPPYLRTVTAAAANLAIAMLVTARDRIAELHYPPGRYSSAPDRRIMLFPAVGYRIDTAPEDADGTTAGAPRPDAPVNWLDAVHAKYSLRSLNGLLYACQDIEAEQVDDPFESIYREYREVPTDQGLAAEGA